MSVVPFFFDPFFNDPFAEFERPLRLFNQNFGMGVTPDEVFSMRPLQHRRGYAPRRTDMVRQKSSGTSAVTNTKDKLEMKLDAHHFRPEEISIKVVDNAVVVEGKHEERSDEHGLIYRHFIRKYGLPEDVDPDKVVSHLSAQGVLTITAPKRAALEAPKEREVKMEVEQGSGEGQGNGK